MSTVEGEKRLVCQSEVQGEGREKPRWETRRGPVSAGLGGEDEEFVFYSECD